MNGLVESDELVRDSAVIETFIVEKGGGVSFVELRRHLEMMMPVTGTMSLQVVPNVVVWANMSERFCNAVAYLLQSRRIHYRATDVLVYVVDGGMLSLPILKRVPPASGTKTEYWIPVSLNPGPSSHKKGRA